MDLNSRLPGWVSYLWPLARPARPLYWLKHSISDSSLEQAAGGSTVATQHEGSAVCGCLWDLEQCVPQVAPEHLLSQSDNTHAETLILDTQGRQGPEQGSSAVHWACLPWCQKCHQECLTNDRFYFVNVFYRRNTDLDIPSWPQLILIIMRWIWSISISGWLISTKKKVEINVYSVLCVWESDYG